MKTIHPVELTPREINGKMECHLAIHFYNNGNRKDASILVDINDEDSLIESVKELRKFFVAK